MNSLYTTAGSYIEHYNDTYRDMFYIEEEKRGFYPEENHVVCGRFEVDLKPGEEKEVSFEINESMLRFWTVNRRMESEPGDFQLWIGLDSTAEKTARFTLTD